MRMHFQSNYFFVCFIFVGERIRNNAYKTTNHITGRLLNFTTGNFDKKKFKNILFDKITFILNRGPTVKFFGFSMQKHGRRDIRSEHMDTDGVSSSHWLFHVSQLLDNWLVGFSPRGIYLWSGWAVVPAGLGHYIVGSYFCRVMKCFHHHVAALCLKPPRDRPVFWRWHAPQSLDTTFHIV